MKPTTVRVRSGTIALFSLAMVASVSGVHAQWDPVPLCSYTITLHQTTDPGLGFCEASYVRCDSNYTCDPGTTYKSCGIQGVVDGFCQTFKGGWTHPDTGECLYGTPDGPPTLNEMPVFGFPYPESCGGNH